jgi:hypothetical protein
MVKPASLMGCKSIKPIAGKMLDVRGCRIEFDDLACGFGFLVIFALHIFNIVGDSAFDLLQSLGVDRAARLIADLEAVIRGRIVAGSDVHRARGFFIHHRIGNDRCGRCSVG